MLLVTNKLQGLRNESYLVEADLDVEKIVSFTGRGSD